MTKRQKRMAVVKWLSGLVGLMGLASLGCRHDRIIVRRKRARPGYQDSISRTASRRHGFLHGEDRGRDALGPMWQRDLDSRSNEPGPGRCRRASERITLTPGRRIAPKKRPYRYEESLCYRMEWWAVD